MAAENDKEKARQPADAGKESQNNAAPQTNTAGGTKDAHAEGARFEGFMAEIVGLEKVRTGIYGEIKQAMCKILEGRDKGRVIRRNFAGRIKKGDIVRLPDTSREDKRIVAR